jgi:F-type H+-transporting ATPase subunit a
MPESFFLVRLLDALLKGIETKAFQSIGLAQGVAAEKAASINQTLSLELMVCAGLLAFFILVRMSLSVERANPAQHVAEMMHELIGGQAEQVIGHGYERFQAFATCIFLFVLLNNVIGIIPGIVTPTSMPWVPLGLAIPCFIYYNYYGLKANGLVGYLKQFAGPIWWLAPLMFVIEVVSHLARILSLTVRLYANMLASDLLFLVGFSMFPLFLPAGLSAFHLIVSVIQAFVFMLLTMIYLTLAVSHEH